MTTRHEQASVGAARESVTGAIPEGDGRSGSHGITEQVQHALAKASFAVVSCVTPSGEPRSSGVVYKILGGRMYVAVAPDSWKAKHIAVNGRVAVTVTVLRGGILSLVVPIPPATISFHGAATVYPAASPQARPALEALASLLPEEGRDTASVVEIVPEGAFVTYGIGVPLMKMRDPVASQARVSVMRGAGKRG